MPQEHEFRRSFVKFLGVFETERITLVGVLVMGSLSELTIMQLPSKISQAFARIEGTPPEQYHPFIFYIGPDEILPPSTLILPDGTIAILAKVNGNRINKFLAPFATKYTHWLCEVRDRIIEDKGFSKYASREWNEFYEEFLNEDDRYAWFCCCREEMFADVLSIYHAMEDLGLLKHKAYDPYEELDISPNDFYDWRQDP